MKTEYKCVVISDTHGDNRGIFDVIEREKPFDILIHCGDAEANLASILGTRTFGYFAVRGNCDMFTYAEDERCVKLGSFRVFVTHGHRYRVSYRDSALIQAGKKEHADVILFGHTHVPEIKEDRENGLLIVNPGSLSRPRQIPRVPTYAVLNITGDRLPEAQIRELV